MLFKKKQEDQNIEYTHEKTVETKKKYSKNGVNLEVTFINDKLDNCLISDWSGDGIGSVCWIKKSRILILKELIDEFLKETTIEKT